MSIDEHPVAPARGLADCYEEYKAVLLAFGSAALLQAPLEEVAARAVELVASAGALDAADEASLGARTLLAQAASDAADAIASARNASQRQLADVTERLRVGHRRVQPAMWALLGFEYAACSPADDEAAGRVATSGGIADRKGPFDVTSC